MALATGLVRSETSRIADILVEFFSVPDDFRSKLPVHSRDEISSLKIERLGSAISDRDGRVNIDYRHPTEGDPQYGAEPINLWVAASSVDQTAVWSWSIRTETSAARRGQPNSS